MPTVLRTVNALLWLAACALLASGLALEWKVESEHEGRFLLGLSGEDWGEVHVILGLVVAGLTAAHLALNWAWIRGLLARLRWPVLLVLALGLLLIATVLAAPVTGGGAGGERSGHHGDDDD